MIWHLYSSFTEIIRSPGANLADKLSVNPYFAELIYSGKEGGFATILENTLGRIYIETLTQDESFKHSRKRVTKGNDMGLWEKLRISRIGIDVSSSGETLYILERIKNLDSNKTNWQRLVVDIGANDGMLSSNSYNFIRWGWSAILVEPQSYQIDLAKRNLQG